MNPIFPWVRLARLVPVRIHIDDVPSGVRLVASITATAKIGPRSQEKRAPDWQGLKSASHRYKRASCGFESLSTSSKDIRFDTAKLTLFNFLLADGANYDREPSSISSLHARNCHRQSTAGRGWLEFVPEKVALAYSVDTYWRNRAEFVQGRAEVVAFLTRKWTRKTGSLYGSRTKWHDDSGNWFRSYGNENWEFNEDGLMRRRFACINDLPIKASERKYHWDRSAPRPADHPGLSDLGL